MPVFENSEVLEDVLFNFFKEMLQDESISSKLLKSKVTVRFNYSNPDLSISVDCSQSEPQVFANDKHQETELELWMKADVAHKFWFGKVNLVLAITKGDIKLRGSMPKLLMLLPTISPAYKQYPVYLRRRNFDKYITE